MGELQSSSTTTPTPNHPFQGASPKTIVGLLLRGDSPDARCRGLHAHACKQQAIPVQGLTNNQPNACKCLSYAQPCSKITIAHPSTPSVAQKVDASKQDRNSATASTPPPLPDIPTPDFCGMPNTSRTYPTAQWRPSRTMSFLRPAAPPWSPTLE